MTTPRLRAFSAHRPSLADEPKYFTRIPDDAIEDPRLPALTRDVFLQLIKGHKADVRIIEVKQRDLASRCRLSERCVRNHLDRLETCGYIRRDRDYSRGGAPLRYILCYELRPSLQLSSPVPTVTAKSTCNRNPRSACNRNPRSACNRNPRSGPTLLFEREINTRETTSNDVLENTPSVSSLSTPESPPNSEPPSAVEAERQTAIADLTARALDLWPDTVRLEARIAEAVDLSPAQARLAIELAQLRDADGWGYVASTMTRWHASGYDDLDCEAEVRAARPKPLKINAAATAQPTFSPPKDEAPTDDEIADTIQAIRDARTPMERKLYLGLLRGHVTRGLVPATVLAEFEERNAR